MTAACRRWPRATRSASTASPSSSTSPSRRRATPRRRLIKKMEELGIGRPSTYAATLSVLRDRDYVRLEKKQLIPEDKGRLVTAFLESFFERYVEYDFTADLEEKLDKISARRHLVEGGAARVLARSSPPTSPRPTTSASPRCSRRSTSCSARTSSRPRADGGDPRQCPTCGNGRLSLKLGKFGAFIGCSNYPECRFTRQLAVTGENGDGGELGGDGTPQPRQGSRHRPRRHGPHRPVRPLRPARRGQRRRREAEAVEPAQGLGRGDHRPRRRARAPRRCPARSASIPRPARRSPPASAATGRSSSTTAPTPTSIRPTRCSRSASTAPSRCSPRSGRAAADGPAAGRRQRR